jgi:orotate phosphoribosyltransferase
MNSNQIAKLLIQYGIVSNSLDSEFVLSSGMNSNRYVDCRKIVSIVELRSIVVDCLVEEIYHQTPGVESICGVATGSVPLAMLVAQSMKLPFIYHRKPKDYGTNKTIEGIYSDKQKVIVIEDVVTTGQSAIRSVVDLENEKLNVLGLYSIYAGHKSGYINNFIEHEINFFPLSTFQDIQAYY